MRKVYYTIFENESGMILEGYSLLNITEPDTPTAQRPKIIHGREQVEKRLEALRPKSDFQKVELTPHEFWAKAELARPSLTIDINPNEYRPSWDNE